MLSMRRDLRGVLASIEFFRRLDLGLVPVVLRLEGIVLCEQVVTVLTLLLTFI